MIEELSANDLQQALDLLDRLEQLGGARELTALAFRLDGWVALDSAIDLPSGARHPEPGTVLWRSSDGDAFLLSDARILLVSPDASAAPLETPLVDAGLPPPRLADALRPHVLRRFLGGARLDELGPPVAATVVADIFSVLPHVGPSSRLFLVRSLVDAMDASGRWDRAFARLRVGLERALSDYSPDVARAAAVGVARLAAGLGPRPPEGDPARGATVLLVSPRHDIRLAGLSALDALPDDALARLADVVGPRLADALTDGDPEMRGRAARLLGRLEADDDVARLAAELEAARGAARADALRRLLEHGDDELAAVVPVVVDAAASEDDAERSAAVEVLRGAAARGGDVARRVVLELLAVGDAVRVGLGVELLPDAAALEEPVAAALRRAADTVPEVAGAAADRVARDMATRGPEEASAGYESLLRHEHREVRRAALRRAARDVADRVALKEALRSIIVEHLHDEDPELRIEAALTIVQLGYPGAARLAGSLAYDPDPLVRRSLAYVMGESGDAAAAAEAARIVGYVDVLFDLARGGTGDDRVRWAAALDELATAGMPYLLSLVPPLLASLPPDTGDAFLRFALDEIDRRVREGTTPDELVDLARHVAGPPHRQREHAVRLAGAIAHEVPDAFELLWVLFTATRGRERDAASRMLAELGERQTSQAVRSRIENLMGLATPDERDLLGSLLRASRR